MIITIHSWKEASRSTCHNLVSYVTTCAIRQYHSITACHLPNTPNITSTFSEVRLAKAELAVFVVLLCWTATIFVYMEMQNKKVKPITP